LLVVNILLEMLRRTCGARIVSFSSDSAWWWWLSGAVTVIVTGDAGYAGWVTGDDHTTRPDPGYHPTP